jgi:hypothetical protein
MPDSLYQNIIFDLANADFPIDKLRKTPQVWLNNFLIICDIMLFINNWLDILILLNILLKMLKI